MRNSIILWMKVFNLYNNKEHHSIDGLLAIENWKESNMYYTISFSLLFLVSVQC